MVILIYDGTLGGWLTCVFEIYERKLSAVHIVKKESIITDAFAETLPVTTDEAKAKRVWTGLQQKLSHEGLMRLYHCYLSEIEGMEDTMLAVARHAFAHNENIEEDFSNLAVLEVAKTARKVWREKHRMEAFVRFQLLKDGFYYSGIEPDYNVLPLILPHFKSRYADQSWLIYDIRRKYGIYYEHAAGNVQEVTLEWKEQTAYNTINKDIFEPEEELYQLLWKDYFKHTGIPARKNMKLHLQHVPRRYWKYLTEKNQ